METIQSLAWYGLMVDRAAKHGAEREPGKLARP